MLTAARTTRISWKSAKSRFSATNECKERPARSARPKRPVHPVLLLSSKVPALQATERGGELRGPLTYGRVNANTAFAGEAGCDPAIAIGGCSVGGLLTRCSRRMTAQPSDDRLLLVRSLTLLLRAQGPDGTSQHKGGGRARRSRRAPERAKIRPSGSPHRYGRLHILRRCARRRRLRASCESDACHNGCGTGRDCRNPCRSP